MSREQVIDKIKKLLRMKRGGTPEEIATALKLAEELAAKHGIELGDVNPDDDGPKSERIGHSEPIEGARIQCECQYVGLICKDYFKVAVFARSISGRWVGFRWVKRWALTFVGTDWDREIATYVFQFLVRHFRREWATKRGRCRNRQAFMWGMYLGLDKKLAERMPKTIVHGSAEEMVWLGREVALRDYIAKHFGELKSSNCAPDDDAAQARWRGYMAGRDTEIRSGVKASAAPGILTGQEGRLLGQ